MARPRNPRKDQKYLHRIDYYNELYHLAGLRESLQVSPSCQLFPGAMGFGPMVSFLWQVSSTLPKEEFDRRYAMFDEAGGERRMCSLLRKIDTYKWKDPLLDKLCNALFGRFPPTVEQAPEPNSTL